MNSKKRRTLAASIALYTLLTSGCSVRDKLDQNVTLKTIRNAIEDKLNGKEIKGTKKNNKKKINDLMKALEKSLKNVE